MSQSQLLSYIVPFVEIERPACPKCQAQMLLARIVPARLGIDIHRFECAACDHVLRTLAAYEDSMKSRALGRWLEGDLRSPTKAAPVNQLLLAI
jgi:hypothetical protein